MTSTIAPAAAYDQDYLAWKGWNPASFATLQWEDARYFKTEMQRLGLLLPTGARVLEIGFGNGSFLAFAQQQGWNVTGVELSKPLVEIATQKGFDAICTDNLGEFADASFDLLVAFDVLEHIRPEDILAYLRNIQRVLKPGGRLLARFPNADSPFGLANQNGDVTHVNAIGLGKIQYFVEQLGMELVSCGGACEFVMGPNPAGIARRAFAKLAKAAINLFVFFVFHPQRNFCSRNLVLVLRRF